MQGQNDDFEEDDFEETEAEIEISESPIKTTAPAATDDTRVNPFAVYAQREASGAFFNGDYIRVDQKEGWIRGQDKVPVGATESFVADMQQANHGWITFAKDGETAKRDVKPVMECPILPPCPECGEIADDHNDKLCKWRPVVYLPLRSATDPSDIVCFTGGGKGARKMLGQLCGVYARPGADREGKNPTIMLTTYSFENKKHGGTTVWPDYKLIGWDYFIPGVPAPPVRLLPKTAATKALPSKRGDMDDEIPF
jgi:hypothetical protein